MLLSTPPSVKRLTLLLRSACMRKLLTRDWIPSNVRFGGVPSGCYLEVILSVSHSLMLHISLRAVQ